LLYRPFENHEFSLEAGRTEQYRNLKPGRSWAPSYNSTTPTRAHNLNTRSYWSAGWDADWETFLTKLSIFQEEGKRQNKSRTWNNVINDWGAPTSGRTPKANNTTIDGSFTLPTDRNVFTFGGQYQENKLTDISDGTGDYQPMKSWQYALFMENDFRITDDLIFTAGLRLDDHEYFGTHWTPRGYLVYHLTSQWTIKGGVSTGYKTPTLKQMSPDFGYSTGRGTAVMYGNPNLKPEESTTEEISLLYNRDNGFSATLTLFHTDFKNKITDRVVTTNYREYVNLDESTIKGLEAGFSYPFLDRFTIRANYTYLDSKQKSGDFKGHPLTLTPRHKADARLDYRITDAVNSYIRVEHMGKQTSASTRSTPNIRYRKSFTTADIGGTYDVNDRVQINMAILNIADKRNDPNSVDGDAWDAIEDGRRFWFGMTVNF
ncbi:MAG: TonB-dependent receptor, partial [Planctomycetes bacterium]|nr:TonB-dependent receptor [Planctomycetota bacterium]